MKSLSSRTEKIAPSLTVAIDTLAKTLIANGKDIVSLGAGEPDFPTPEHIRRYAQQAIDTGKTRYTAPVGILEVREAVCHKLKRENGLDYKPNQIVMTSGAKHAVYNCFLALLNEGDEVIIPAPYWVTYPELVKLVSGIPIFVESTAENKFKISAQDLEKAITPKTKCVVLNNPCNPTGTVYSKGELEALAKVIRKHDLFCISDEVYEHFVYEDTFTSVAAIEGMYERTLLVNGLSKSHCMTGWRIGYVAAPEPIALLIGKVQSQTTHHPSNIAQYGALAALDGPFESVLQMKKAFQERRNYMYNRLQKIPGVVVSLPEGAFYLFPTVSALFGKRTPEGVLIDSSSSFCKYLLEFHGLAIVPGIAFGNDKSVRFSYAANMDTLQKACDRFEAGVKALL